MVEIRIHGRGGQGAVVASKVLADAVFREGKWVQVFPEFGVERRGAPVTAFTRIDDQPINIRCKIYEPDHVVVLDPVLLESVDVASGLKEGGWVLINSDRSPEEFDFGAGYRVATVDATSIAVKHGLGSRATPIVNTAIVGALSKVTEIVGIESVVEAVRDEVPVKVEENVAAAREAYETAVVAAKTAKKPAKAAKKTAKGAKLTKKAAKTAESKPPR